jgi:phospholipase/carboxylesterase
VSAEATIHLAGLPAIAVGDATNARAVVVLLHGFMMTPGDLAPFAHSMGGDVYYLFPEGPVAAAPQGRAWWHIDPIARAEALARGPRDFAPQHPPDLASTRARVTALLDEVDALAAGRRLVVGGFSQGGMVIADLLVRAPRRLDAVALLSSSRVAFAEWPPLADTRPLADLPVLVSHGDADPDLAFSTGEALRDAMLAAGAAVTWLPFSGGHEIPLLVWRRLRKLIGG